MVSINIREWTRREFPGTFLTPRDLQTAVALEQSGRALIRPSAAGISVETKSYVGLIKLESLELVVRPKFIDDRDFFKMLAYAFRLAGIDPLHEYAPAPVTGGRITDILALYLVREIDQIILRGIIRRYREQTDLLTALRGKIKFSRAVGCFARGAMELPCCYEDLTGDTIENRVLLRTLNLIAPLISSPALLFRVRFLGELFSEIAALESDLRLLFDRLAQHGDRLNNYYQKALHLCHLIFYSLSFTFEGSSTAVYPAFLFDMNRLFESFLGRLLQDCAPSGYQVKCQNPLGAYYAPGRGRMSPLIPDFQVWWEGRRLFLADAKYKLYEEMKVSPGDLYQLTVYSLAGEAEKTIIYYPSTVKKVDFYDLTLPQGNTKVKIYLLGIPMLLLLDKLDPTQLDIKKDAREQIWSILTEAD